MAPPAEGLVALMLVAELMMSFDDPASRLN